MIKNGKNEKIGFNPDVINKAVKTRISIAEKEAEFYTSIYERTKKFLSEKDNENLKLSRYKKLLRDVSVKLEFLNAEKEYIVGFLDNERITSMNTKKVHNNMMKEACENFDLDIKQIENLYELILRETTNKSTKKGYKELYNKTYLRDIEEKEKSFEQEANKVKINMGTVINSNYWRIEGIKNIYTVFQEEVSRKFDKDLSDYRIEDVEEEEEIENSEDIEEKIDTYIKNNAKDEIDNVDEKYDNDNKEKEDYEDEEQNEFYDDNEYDLYGEDKKLQKKINKKIEKRIEKENKIKKKNRNNYEDIPYSIENDKVDMIIQNTRKAQIRELKKKQKKSIFGKFFD